MRNYLGVVASLVLAFGSVSRAHAQDAGASGAKVFADYVGISALRTRYVQVSAGTEGGTGTSWDRSSSGSEFDATVQRLYFRGGLGNLILRVSLLDGANVQAGVLIADLVEIGGYLGGRRTFRVDSSLTNQVTYSETDLTTGPFALFTIVLADMMALEFESRLGIIVGSSERIEKTYLANSPGTMTGSEQKTSDEVSGFEFVGRFSLVLNLTDHLDYSPEFALEWTARTYKNTSPNVNDATEFTGGQLAVAFIPLGLRFRF